jgi:phosphoribosylglycinamide formyltransferase 1
VSKRLKTAILISGRGSNMAALIEACSASDFPAEIVLVLSNVVEAAGIEQVRATGIPAAIVAHKDYLSRESFEAALAAKLAEAGVELICLAGFMRILSDGFVRRWQGRLINIHPSLLPAFKGIGVHEQAIASGVRISGCTVHFVTPALDSGPPIAQAAVPVHPSDTPETLGARVLRVEHRLYPLALRLVAEGRARLAGDTVVFRDCAAADAILINPPCP